MKKIVLLVLVGLLGLGLFACGQSKTTDGNKDKLIVGIDDAFPPMTYRDPNTNDLIGFDVDMGEAIADRIGVTLEWQPVEWKGVIQSLKTKKIDLVICGLTITPERAEQIFLSSPYMNAGISMAVKKDNTTINTVEDMRTKKIGVQTGSSGAQGLTDLGFVDNVTTYDAYPSAFNDLGIGRIDVVAVDTVVGSHFIKEKGDQFKLLPEKIINEEYAIGVEKSNTELQKKINDAIAAMKADGTLKQIAVKWFGEENAANIIPQ